MTDILSSISRGKRLRHIFALIYGTDGVGKSTLCSHAPNPIFVGAEKGTEQLDVARFPLGDRRVCPSNATIMYIMLLVV